MSAVYPCVDHVYVQTDILPAMVMALDAETLLVLVSILRKVGSGSFVESAIDAVSYQKNWNHKAVNERKYRLGFYLLTFMHMAE